METKAEQRRELREALKEVYMSLGTVVLRGFSSRVMLALLDDADRCEKLEEALREIAKGEGRFSLDQLEHASNTIDAMKLLAIEALGEE